MNKAIDTTHNDDSSKKSIPVVCLILIDSYDRILITKRPPGKQLGGLWEFPGGKVEHNEVFEVALRRELSEELQLEVDSLQRLSAIEHCYEFGVVRLIPFVSRCEERPAVKLLEHSEFRWVSYSELPAFDWVPADLTILNQIRALLV